MPFCIKKPDINSLRASDLWLISIGFVWRFLGRRHVARQALPDAIALSRLVCRVGTLVG